MKKYNNADTTLAGDLQASGTSFVVKTGEGALFPADGFPYDLTIEHYEGTIATKREIISISNRSGDAFTIAARKSQTCVQDDSANPKTRTANALSFASGDRVYLTVTEGDINTIETEINTNIPADLALKLDKTTYNAEKIAYASSSTGNDDYVVTIPDISSLTDGRTFKIKADIANTGTATLNVNGLGVLSLKKLKTSAFSDLETGDIIANQIFFATYNSSSGGFFQFSIDPAQVVIPDVTSIKGNFVAGENISAGKSFFTYDGSFSDTGSIQQLSQNASINITNGQSFGQTILTPATGNNLKINTVQAYKGGYTGSVGRNLLTAYIYSSLGGTLLATSNTIQVHTANTVYTLTFATPAVLNNNTTYYIHYVYSDSSGASQPFPLLYQNTNVYAGGTAYFNGAVQANYDIYFTANYQFDLNLGQAYNTDSSNANKCNFEGFALSSVTAGQSFLADIEGVTSILSGLTAGASYYLSTSGGIANTMGTNVAPVGKAIATNKLIINKIQSKNLPVITPTVGASPFTYQNNTGRPILLSITGGTVSQVAVSRDNTNYYQVASVTNAMTMLSPGDYAKITYSATPILKAFTF